MSTERAEEYRFQCPHCDTSLRVNGPMKAALIERGCVICGAAVAMEAFSVVDATP